MSSMSPNDYLTTDDLNMLQQVLEDAGYRSDIRPRPGEFDIASKLIVKLFQRGMTQPSVLSAALIRYMGAAIPERKPYLPPDHRFSIQGITPLRQTFH